MLGRVGLDRHGRPPGPLSRRGAGIRSPCATKSDCDTLMMSCDAPRQLTASSERFSRATPTIWSTGERAGQRLALKVHEVRRDVHRAYARCRPTPGPARARPRRRDPLVSRRVGSGKRRRFRRRPRRSSRGARRARTASRTRASCRTLRTGAGSSPRPGSVRSRVREARPSARLRRRSRRAPAAASSGPRTATRPRASWVSCPGSTRSRTATSARCSGRATTTAAAPRLQMEDCALRDGFGRAADVDVP